MLLTAGQFFTSTSGRFFLTAALVTACAAAPASVSQHDARMLKHYKEHYSEEIVDYCLKDSGANHGLVASCLARQQVLKDRLFENAHAILGRRSLVQVLYDECVDYYPHHGVARIGGCVDARLVLRDKLDNEPIEREIYRRCDDKWRRHGASAVTNCSSHAANYYRDKGRLRD